MTLQQQIRSNRLRTLLLLVVFALIVAGLAGVVSALYDPSLAPFVVVGGVLYGIYAWFMSWRMVAAMTRAKPIDSASAPGLYSIVDTVAIAAGLAKTPEVRVIDDPAPNAFAAGRDPDHSYVAVTTGLLKVMSKRELEAVIAHELAHIRNRDVRLMTLVVVLVGVIALISDLILRMTFYGGRRRDVHPIVLVVGLAALVLAPIAAIGVQMAVSRRREFLADASAAEITNDPEGMALALKRLMLDTQSVRDTSRSTAHLYIESPLHKASGVGAAFRGLFNTHPPLEERIAALGEAGGFELDLSGRAEPAPTGLPAGGQMGLAPSAEPRQRFCTQCGTALMASGDCPGCGMRFPARTSSDSPDDSELEPPSFRSLHH